MGWDVLEMSNVLGHMGASVGYASLQSHGLKPVSVLEKEMQGITTATLIGTVLVDVHGLMDSHWLFILQ